MTNRKPPRGKRKAPEPVFDRRLMEQHLGAVGRLLEGRDFASIDEANAFLQEAMVDGTLDAIAPATPLQEAQEVIYEALEETGKERLAQARQALDISPDCADAYVLLAEASDDVEEAHRLYGEAVRAGERALGPETFVENAGRFWGIVETRPYMWARLGLAETLWYMSERPVAIEHLQEMLQLNPGDNQGIRYILAGWLLATKNDAALTTLLAQYSDERSAQWAYSRVLLAFRRSRATARAQTALEKAMEINPFVPLYLLGVDPLPKTLPQYYSPGDRDEAIMYLAESVEGWLKTPGAIEWLVKAVIRLAVDLMSEHE